MMRRIALRVVLRLAVMGNDSNDIVRAGKIECAG